MSEYDQRFVERFEKYVNKDGEGGCHVWIGSIRPTGYGQFSVARSKAKLSHRISYQIYRGPIPEGLFVLHHCDNRKCVNPDHLFVGTQADNLQDMARKGVTSGERNWNAKLTNDSIRSIRRMISDGRVQTEIARQFGVSQATITNIKRGKSWGCVPLESGATE